MCGIVGIVHREKARPVPSDVIERMCTVLAHRGPDDHGVHAADGVGLGMRRLSIIDLAGGQQPVYTEDRSTILICNGEIYNYRDLRRELLARGHQLRTRGDTETIAHLYEDYGTACTEKLRGMFAFALWDGHADRLLLARDRFGIKPLYYVEAPWGIGFASELKALLAVGLSAGELDWDALDIYFQIGYIPAPHSPFRDVRKLEPGHILEWDRSGRSTITRYWDLPRDETAAPSNLEECVLQWLDDSVAAHLVSDVPVATFLSGGLDSSAIVSSMALQGEIPHAFTARYHGSGAQSADETDLARKLANRYGAKLTVVDVYPDISNIFERVVFALDEPLADESAIPSWLVSEAVSAQYKVALVGTGGDELFAGYRRHIGLLAGGLYAKLPAVVRKALSAVANTVPEPRGASLTVDRIKRFLRSSPTSVVENLLGFVAKLPDGFRQAHYAPQLRETIKGSPAAEHFTRLLRRAGNPTGLRAALYLDYKTYLPDDLLALSDRMAMAHSLELRVPFVDHELVQSVFALPDRSKVRCWQTKHLLRRALRSRLPEEHFRAPKRGFIGPTATWLRNELRDMLVDELSPNRIARLGYFDVGKVQNLLDDHFSRRHNREGILWALLCFSTWHRLYVEPYAGARYWR